MAVRTHEELSIRNVRYVRAENELLIREERRNSPPVRITTVKASPGPRSSVGYSPSQTATPVKRYSIPSYDRTLTARTPRLPNTIGDEKRLGEVEMDHSSKPSNVTLDDERTHSSRASPGAKFSVTPSVNTDDFRISPQLRDGVWDSIQENIQSYLSSISLPPKHLEELERIFSDISDYSLKLRNRVTLLLRDSVEKEAHVSELEQKIKDETNRSALLRTAFQEEQSKRHSVLVDLETSLKETRERELAAQYEHSEAQKQYSSLRDQVESFRDQCETKDTELQNLRQQLRDSSVTVEALKQQIDEWQGKAMSFKRRCSELENADQTSSEAAVSEIRHLKAKSDELQNTNRLLLLRINELGKEAEVAAVKKQKLEAIIQRHDRQLEEEREKSHKAANEVSIKNEQLHVDELMHLHQQIQTLSQQLQSSERELGAQRLLFKKHQEAAQREEAARKTLAGEAVVHKVAADSLRRERSTSKLDAMALARLIDRWASYAGSTLDMFHSAAVTKGRLLPTPAPKPISDRLLAHPPSPLAVLDGPDAFQILLEKCANMESLQRIDLINTYYGSIIPELASHMNFLAFRRRSGLESPRAQDKLLDSTFPKLYEYLHFEWSKVLRMSTTIEPGAQPSIVPAREQFLFSHFGCQTDTDTDVNKGGSANDSCVRSLWLAVGFLITIIAGMIAY